MSNAQPTLFDKATTDNSISGFINREAKRMWPSDEHRKRSIAQVNKFLAFRDNLSRPLTQFFSEDLDDFADHLIDTGSSQATVNRYLASITKVFNHAVNKRRLKFAPRATFFKEDSNRVRYFTDEEVANILSFFRQRGDWWMADMVTLGCKLGMRRGEIVALGEGRATISADGQWLHLPECVTKTSKERYLPLSNEEAHRAAHRLADGLSKHYSKKAFDYRWGLCKREYARNDSTFVFHVTRHTAATRMANELEVPTVIIAEYMGHASLKTTAKYAHAKPTTLLDIGARM